ncbi:MAG: DegT/DnrJ/EryC1/StrS family aminotransferase [Xanthobacteraceae bacterium]|nr:DegT/DnrJ/EryC1/StrS family aminotransferase [Xanthobacteraceae bacterium]
MIPFLDLNAQNSALKEEIDAAIRAVIESSEFCLGPAVDRFEMAFAAFCGVRHAVAVNSGTSALHLALLALDAGPGKEVVTAASTFVATVAAIRYTGARAVLLDIDPERYTLDPALLEAAITPQTAAIMPVHLYGQVAEMDRICDIAARHSVPVIEDAAQAHGASFRRAPAGSHGRVACFSFYPGKILGAFGEGGAVVTNDDALARKMRAMRDWGQYERSVHHYPCFNYRMEGIQGAVLGVKLRHVSEWVSARQRVAGAYDRLFRERIPSGLVKTPRPCPDGLHAYHQYAIRVDQRDRVRAELHERGIQTGVHYPRPVHLQPGFSELGRAGQFPHAEALARTTLSLPIYPELPSGAEEAVVNTLAAIVDRTAARRKEPTGSH